MFTKIKTLALAATATFALTASAQAADLTIASWGGSYQAAQSKGIFQPVAKAMGIKIKE